MLAVLALAGAGCGDADDEPAGSGDAPAAGPEDPYLEVTLAPDGERAGEATMVEIAACTDAGRACSELRALSPEDFEPVPPGRACTQIFGGPDTVWAVGSVDGEAVDATFTRANGCEIDRFERIVPLLEALFPDYRPGASLAP